jgi:hypothetical protein
MVLLDTHLLTAVAQIEDSLKVIKQQALAFADPTIKFNKPTLMKKKYQDMGKSQALVSAMMENSSCMNVNDIANELFDLKDITPDERTRHMKALNTIITRTPEVISAGSKRGYWKLR